MFWSQSPMIKESTGYHVPFISRLAHRAVCPPLLQMAEKPSFAGHGVKYGSRTHLNLNHNQAHNRSANNTMMRGKADVKPVCLGSSLLPISHYRFAFGLEVTVPLEITVRIELTLTGLQPAALPLGYVIICGPSPLSCFAGI